MILMVLRRISKLSYFNTQNKAEVQKAIFYCMLCILALQIADPELSDSGVIVRLANLEGKDTRRIRFDHLRRNCENSLIFCRSAIFSIIVNAVSFNEDS
jgi:hypothetical protein